MTTCPSCIAVRARIRTVAMHAAGRSPEGIAEALNAIYRQGFFYVREYERKLTQLPYKAIYYRAANGEYRIKEFK